MNQQTKPSPLSKEWADQLKAKLIAQIDEHFAKQNAELQKKLEAFLKGTSTDEVNSK